jgi:hypothetical protein
MPTSLKYNGVFFDDFTKNDDGTYWSQICESCRQKYSESIGNDDLDLNSGNGICGVAGCENESDHYIDFNPDLMRLFD